MTLVYFLNFLAQFKKRVAGKRAGSMVKWKASPIVGQWAWAGGFGQVGPLLQTLASFSEVTNVLCGFFNCLEGDEEHRASGFAWNSVFTSTGHFWPPAFSRSQLSRYP